MSNRALDTHIDVIRTITHSFGSALARRLADKILPVYPAFDATAYRAYITKRCRSMSYTERLVLHAEALGTYLPADFKSAARICHAILGPENPHETGMFKEYYWLMPIGKFVELYGINDLHTSLKLIEELTKRNTGEYAIRPFVRKYPAKTLAKMRQWAESKNFHLRRLASEGLRPKLPWATKLDLFIERPKPVFEILELLKADPIRFVQRSVANNVRDYCKVNPVAAEKLLARWSRSPDSRTQWIVKHATR